MFLCYGTLGNHKNLLIDNLWSLQTALVLTWENFPFFISNVYSVDILCFLWCFWMGDGSCLQCFFGEGEMSWGFFEKFWEFFEFLRFFWSFWNFFWTFWIFLKKIYTFFDILTFLDSFFWIQWFFLGFSSLKKNF